MADIKHYLDDNGKINIKHYLDDDEKTCLYQIKRLIGSGGFGVVYFGCPYPDLTETESVIKEIRIHNLEEGGWMREIADFRNGKLKKILKLFHENLVRYHAGGYRPATSVETACVVLLLEYCSGKD